MQIIEFESLEWPVIIRHQDSAELSYIKTLDHWQQFIENSSWLIGEGDRLIDYKGLCYELYRVSGEQIYSRECKPIPLEVLTMYVKEHMHNRGICCLSKLNIDSVASAHDIVGSAEDY